MKISQEQMTLLRRLYLNEDFDHKRHYSKFHPMIGTYIGWALGHAYLLPEGENLVETL